MTQPELPDSVWEFLEHIRERGWQVRDCDVEERFSNALTIARNHDPPLIENDLTGDYGRVGYNGIRAVEAGSADAQDHIAEYFACQNGTYCWSLSRYGKLCLAMRAERAKAPAKLSATDDTDKTPFDTNTLPAKYRDDEAEQGNPITTKYLQTGRFGFTAHDINKAIENGDLTDIKQFKTGTTGPPARVFSFKEAAALKLKHS